MVADGFFWEYFLGHLDLFCLSLFLKIAQQWSRALYDQAI